MVLELKPWFGPCLPCPLIDPPPPLRGPRSLQSFRQKTVLEQSLFLCPCAKVGFRAALAPLASCYCSVAGSVLPLGCPRKSSRGAAYARSSCSAKFPSPPRLSLAALYAPLLGRGVRLSPGTKRFASLPAPARRKARKGIARLLPHFRSVDAPLSFHRGQH